MPGKARKGMEQFFVVGLVTAGLTGIACGIDPRCTIEKIDGKSGVIGNTGHPKVRAIETGLLQGVRFKGIPIFLGLFHIRKILKAPYFPG
jgi:hypothetical protein